MWVQSRILAILIDQIGHNGSAESVREIMHQPMRACKRELSEASDFSFDFTSISVNV